MAKSNILIVTVFFAVAIYLKDNHLDPIGLLIIIIVGLFVMKFRKILWICVSLFVGILGFFFGIFRYEQFVNDNFQIHLGSLNQNIVIEGVIVEDLVKVSNGKMRTVVRDGDLGRVLVYIEEYSNYEVGDEIFLIGKLVLAPEFKDFSYLKYLQTESIFFVINNVQRDRKIGEASGIIGDIYRYRNDKIELIDRSFRYPVSALVKGMVFGISSDFNNEWEDILKSTGTMHIVAVSGFNISVVFNFIFVLDRFWNRRYINFLSIFLLVLFTILIGPYNYSALRAVVFAFFLIVGKILGRKISNLNLIALALFSILIFNPLAYRSLSLVFSISSILAIFYVNKVVEKYFKVPAYLALALAISLLTGIVQIYFFNSFSVSGIFINIIISPLVGLITIVSILFVLVGGFFQILSVYVGLVVSLFLSALKFGAQLDLLYLNNLIVDVKVVLIIFLFVFYLCFNKYFISVYKKLSLKRSKCYV